MKLKNSLGIKLSRTFPAPKWRVIRMVTKIGDLKALVPTIQEARVISKSRNTIRTEWRILVDGIPISWTEEDTLDLMKDRIHFKAVDGDFQEFQGVWEFRDHPDGTEVSVEVSLNVGVPAIKEFADEHTRKLVAKNFYAIFEAIERQMISIRYTGLKSGLKEKVAGFGILGHPYNFNHLLRFFKAVNPGYNLPSREFLKSMFGVTPSFKAHQFSVRSATGEEAHGSFILCTFIPDMVAEDIESVFSKVVYACRLAEKAGAGIVTLGGFASMVGEKYGKQISEIVDIPITTGNTYTAVLAVDGIEKAVGLLGKDMKDVCVAIVGGTGDIGSACARALSLKARKIIVTGRTRSNLRALKRELKTFGKAKIVITTNNHKAVKNADVIIASANSSASIIKIDWFKPGAIVCDLAYPKNISYMDNRKDILVFSGGLASVPTPIDMGFDIGMPSPEVCYGCFCEVLVLALERRYENFSFGRGNITLEKMQDMRQMAAKHGFKLAPFYWADKQIEEEHFGRVKSAI